MFLKSSIEKLSLTEQLSPVVKKRAHLYCPWKKLVKRVSSLSYERVKVSLNASDFYGLSSIGTLHGQTCSGIGLVQEIH